jgi:ABC-type Fe3+-hydroxamate transport system substrate-binding protein
MSPAILSALCCCLPLAEPEASPGPRVTYRRVIANAPSNAEIVCALGAADRLVGVSRYVDFPEQLAPLPRVGGLDDPDLETLVALRPDLILQRGHNPHVERLCQKNGIRLYQDRTDSLATLDRTIAEIGGLLEREPQADALRQSIRKRLAAIRARAPDSHPRVLLAIRAPDRLAPVTTVGQPSFLTEVIAIAGGESVYADNPIAYPQIGLEEVIAARPDVILDVLPGERIDAQREQELRAQWDRLADLPAVRSGRVHFLTEAHVLVPGPRVVQVAQRFFELIHPEVIRHEP